MFYHQQYDDRDVITIRKELWVDGLSDYVRRCPLTKWQKATNGWKIVIMGSPEARQEVVVWINSLRYGFRPTKEEYEKHWEKIRGLAGGKGVSSDPEVGGGGKRKVRKRKGTEGIQ